MKTLAVALAALSVTASATAGPILYDTWYEFGFGPAGTWATDGSNTVPVPGTVQADAPPWTFSGPVTLALVTDAFRQGDSFSLYDNGVFVGSTPAVAIGNGGVIDPDLALLDPSYSSGQFMLGAGNHSLTILVDNSPFQGGAGFLKITAPVPEAGGYLFALGMLGLAAFGRFSRSR